MKKTIGTCKDCLHFESTDANFGYYGDDSGDCDNPAFRDSGDFGAGQHPALGSGVMVFAIDGTSAGFVVGPGFGCIHWTEKRESAKTRQR